MNLQLRPALACLLGCSALTGLAYPFAITGLARVLFPHQAGGSLLRQDGRVIGSALIGQSFTDPGHFWGRPSATSPGPYNAAAGLISGSRPLPEAVTRSTGTGPVAVGSAARRAAMRVATASASAGLLGARLEAVLAAAL